MINHDGSNQQNNNHHYIYIYIYTIFMTTTLRTTTTNEEEELRRDPQSHPCIPPSGLLAPCVYPFSMLACGSTFNEIERWPKAKMLRCALLCNTPLRKGRLL